jgi:integrase
MPRPAGSRKTPSYCHHKAKGLAYVTIGGKPIYLGAYGTRESRAAYDRVVGEFLAGGRQSPPDPSTSESGMTIAMLIEGFWAHAVAYYNPPPFAPKRRPAGELGNYWDVLKPLNRLYGNTIAADFGPRALQALQLEMVKLGWCRNVINRQTSRIKAVFKWGVAQELVPAGVHHALSTVGGLRRGRAGARDTERVKPVDEAHIEAVLPWLSRHVQAMVKLQLLTGARSSEICNLRRCDIDTGGKVWIYRPASHKTAHHGHTREIRIGREGRRILEQFLKPDLNAYLFSPIDAENERRSELRASRQSAVQPSQLRRAQLSRRRRRARAPMDHYTDKSYRRAIARACERADEWAKGGRVIGNDERILPRWHPHQLRHTAATRWRRQFGPEATLTLLGDRNTRMIDVYAERDARSADDIIAEVG